MTLWDATWPDPSDELVRTALDAPGGDVLLRIRERSGYRWIEIVVAPNGARSVWDCSSAFRSQAEALEWLARADPDFSASR